MFHSHDRLNILHTHLNKVLSLCEGTSEENIGKCEL
jgi:hypothetical protein